MKKFYILCAILASAMATSCANTDDLNEVMTETATATAPYQLDKEKVLETQLYAVCSDIVQMHLQFDYFRAALPAHEITNFERRHESGKTSMTLDQLINIIHHWWLNDECFDVLVEYDGWQEFKELFPKTEYVKKYDFGL